MNGITGMNGFPGFAKYTERKAKNFKGKSLNNTGDMRPKTTLKRAFTGGRGSITVAHVVVKEALAMGYLPVSGEVC